MSNLIKTYKFSPPSAGTNVHNATAPQDVSTFSTPQPSKFFSQRGPVESRGAGNVMDVENKPERYDPKAAFNALLGAAAKKRR